MTLETEILIAPSSEGADAIPSYRDRMEAIQRLLLDGSSLGLLLIDASELSRVEQMHGRRVYRDVLARIGSIVSRLRGQVVRQPDLITRNRQNGDQFFVFLSRKREDKTYTSTDLDGLGDRVSRALNKSAFEEMFPYLKGKPNISVGHSIVIHNPLVEEEILIDRLIEDARTMARFKRFRADIRNKEKLQEIIIKEELTTLFQPIVALGSGEVVGHEALTRGPRGSEYENPYVLFDTAKEVGLIFELDRICRTKALVASRRLDPQAQLFVNCLPTTIHDPEFKGAYLADLLTDVRRRPQNVVIELSEREAIDDYASFRAALAHYSDLGFSIAVDDTGAGYSSLEAIVELEPNYLKLDISMVRGIHGHLLKQELIRAIATFAAKIRATIIAEGIETEAELDTLKRLGVPLGQGFFLGRPVEIR